MRKLTLFIFVLAITANIYAQDYSNNTNGKIEDYFTITRYSSVKLKKGKTPPNIKWKDYTGKVSMNEGWEAYQDWMDDDFTVLPNRALIIVVKDKKGKEHKYAQYKPAVIKIGKECNYENNDNAGEYINCQNAIFKEFDTGREVEITMYVYKTQSMLVVRSSNFNIMYRGERI